MSGGDRGKATGTNVAPENGVNTLPDVTSASDSPSDTMAVAGNDAQSQNDAMQTDDTKAPHDVNYSSHTYSAAESSSSSRSLSAAESSYEENAESLLQINIAARIYNNYDTAYRCLQVSPPTSQPVYIARNARVTVHVHADMNRTTNSDVMCPDWFQFIGDPDSVMWILLQGPTECRRAKGVWHFQDGWSYRKWVLCRRWASPGIDFSTKSNSIYLAMEVFDLIKPYDAVLVIRAVPPSVKGDLEVRRVSPTLGYIQTPRWQPDSSDASVRERDARVRIPVPPGHVVIVSLVQVLLHPQRPCQDRLELYVQDMRHRHYSEEASHDGPTLSTGHQQDSDSTWDTNHDLSDSRTSDTQRDTLDPDRTDFKHQHLHEVKNWNSGGPIKNSRGGDNWQTTSIDQNRNDAPNQNGMHNGQSHSGSKAPVTDENRNIAQKQKRRPAHEIDVNGKDAPTLTKPQWTVCARSRELPTPRVFTDVAAISVRLLTSPTGDKTTGLDIAPGFRLLFSFHQNSAQPKQLPNGQWNCSVPDWATLKQHFLCNLITECAGGEDESDCDYTTCPGRRGVRLGSKCYSLHVSRENSTWQQADQECLPLGGRLVAFNTPAECYPVVFSLRLDRPLRKDWSRMLIGLSSATSDLLIYRHLHQWTDNTIAFYRPNDLKQESAGPVKGVLFFDFYFNTIQLGIRMAEDIKSLCRSYLCYHICEAYIIPVTADVSPNNTSSGRSDEVHFASSGTRHSVQAWFLSVNSSSLHLPFPSVKCPDGHLTHTFLANDVTSKCWSTDDVVNSVHCESRDSQRPCQTSVTRMLELYRCESWEQRVPYSLLCDRRYDCRDQSDEDFCVFPPCNLTVEFECQNKQCVEQRHVCDDFPDCKDHSDELCYHEWGPKRNDPPMIVHFDKRGLRYEKMTDPAKCAKIGTHFQCANGDLCLPVFLRCNGVHDCPGREDEADCRSYTCPGVYRCRGSAVCLHTRHLCDDIPQCPQHDDEHFCNLACPTNCTCQGLSYLCTQPFSAHLHPAVRFLDARDSGMKLTALGSNTLLVHLSLARCDVTNLGNVTLANLCIFDLSYNQLNKISGIELRSFPNLKLLILRGNPFKFQFKSDDSSFYPHQNLRQLDLSQVFIEQLDVRRLGFAPNIHSLNLSQSGIQHVSATGFQFLKYLSRLDLRGCPLTTFPLDLFTGLGELETIDADNYRICCPGVLPQYFDLAKCKAFSPAISTCANLIGAKSNHIILSFIIVLSFFSNTANFITRVFIRRNSHHGFGGVLLTHLTAADFLMALHLGVVLVADASYRDRYVFSDQQWRHSAACSVSGFLATLSSVVSTTVLWLLSSLCVRTLCETRCIHQLGEVSTHAMCVTVWVAGAVLASLPLLPVTSLRGEFSHTALCRPFPETASDLSTPIHDLLEFFSLVASLLLAVGIAVVNLHESNDDKFTFSNSASGSDAKPSPRPRHDRFRRQVGKLLVFSCLCRFLVGVFSVSPVRAHASARDVRLSVSLVVLPLSSALNPVFLWLGMATERARRQRHERLMKRLLAQRKNC